MDHLVGEGKLRVREREDAANLRIEKVKFELSAQLEEKVGEAKEEMRNRLRQVR